MNRKLERKVKEVKIQADEERINLQSQMDQVGTDPSLRRKDGEANGWSFGVLRMSLGLTWQLTQRLKTAKRQMDEAEEEIERLEHSKKKLQREVDEQMEANEQLNGQLNTLRNEMR